MSNQAKDLMERFAKQANGYELDDVGDAAANMIVNLLKQKHLRLKAAEEELEDYIERMKENLKAHHYNKDGARKNSIIINPAMLN